MKTSSTIIVIAFLLALVPFLGFPDVIDRVVIAVGGVTLMILEVARVYRHTRRTIETEGGSDTPRRHDRQRKKKKTGIHRLIHRLRGIIARTRSSKETSGDSEDFNVYQL